MSAVFTGDEILQAVSGQIVSGAIGSGAGKLTWVLEDIGPGDWFIAMPQAAEDTHDELSRAFEQGARGCIVNRRSRYRFAKAGGTLISVADTRLAVLDLARHWRQAVNPRVIAVVATVGRKAIINMLEFQLKDKFRCHKAFESDSLSCLPAVLAMPDNTEILLAEVSGVERGDIARIGNCLTPDLAIIGKTQHPLPSSERNARTAALHCEILDTMRDYEQGSAVIHDQNPALKERALQILCGLRSIMFSQAPDIAVDADTLACLTENRDFGHGQNPTESDIWCAVKGAQALGLSPAMRQEFINLV